MAEFLWTFAVQELLKKTVSLAAQQIGLAWGFKKDLLKMRDSLLMLHAILRDVDRIKSEYPEVKPWVEKLQDIVFEADVLLDDLAYERLRRKVETGKDAMVRNFVSLSKNPLVFRLKMANRIKAISRMLKEHYSAASVVGLVAITSKEIEPDLSQIHETDSFLDEFGVIGRDEEVSEIVNKLIELRNSETLSVLPIVGMGGLGKTAVAKLIFNHEVIRGNFDRTIWVCVSDPFVINKILRAILETLNPNSGGLESKEALLQEIQKWLQDKNYFLVLDDVWNENLSLWNELKACLLKITRKFGNVVVVTSRSEEVAKIMETHSWHRLKKLSNDHCWSLFEKCAFGSDSPTIPKLDMIRKELVENFCGIPLVVKVLGGTMKLYKNYERLQSPLKYLTRIPLQDENRVLSTIKLSVDRLPSPSLKQCFAYCSNFPHDFEFRKDSLIQMWIAQGFIQPPEEVNVTMEDIGDNYFNILLSRSLFQDVVKDKRGRAVYFKMHDFIHDVACAISNDGRKTTLDSSNEHPRKLHMLTFGRHVFHSEIANFTYLRVLITHSSYFILELPNSIGSLKHLRYIDISNSSISKLPESLGLLYNLQTLKLGRFIQDLPSNLRNLICLRHLEFYTDPSNQFKQMPQHLGQLIQLQTLSCFIVGLHEGYKIDELGSLKNLKGNLSLYCLERVKNKKEAMAAKLVEKEKIFHLEFQWGWKHEREGDNYNDLDVLEGLQPHKNLQALRIRNFAGELLPSRIFVENLVEIYLHDCERCETLPMLGQLPKLEALEIRNLPSVRRIGDEFYGNYFRERTLFLNLKSFHIFEMKNLEHWGEISCISNYTMFPHLESLSIICCGKLMNIPNFVVSYCKRLEGDDVTSRTFPSFRGCGKLRSLKILGCENLSKLRDGLEFCSSVENLWLSNFSDLNLQNMQSLCCLSIRDFQKLPYGIASLLNLKDLSIHGDLNVYDWSPLIHLRSLENLVLAHSGSDAAQLPQELEHLTALRSLHISHFDDVEALPEWFGNFTSLEILKLYNCRNLKNLPSQKALSNLVRLSSLRVYGCSQLELGKGCFEQVKTSNGSIKFVQEIHIPFYWS
ncbi:putative disease resistance protein RGA3 [Cucurbita pepo subsp. pepo]|uniref:putative disease resistance protein RGA3 n=1 Tax=Cucurbita pepo subsp. pepo TaxID=3664 RepID=UPI000C9D7519|nr:putative disease resistance protein RGA3 [Cucurbita pepo subsp. pepo]